jgi:hypothetical protein
LRGKEGLVDGEDLMAKRAQKGKLEVEKETKSTGYSQNQFT